MNNSEQSETVEKDSKEQKDKESEPVKKTQGQLLQEALGLQPTDIQRIEKKIIHRTFFGLFF